MEEKDKRTEYGGERQGRGQNVEEKDKEEDRIWRRKTRKRTEYGGERLAVSYTHLTLPTMAVV